MQRRPLTFDEQVNARYVVRSQSQCWPWLGSLQQGRPAIGLRHVMRYIYQRDVAPIPPGMVLMRADHGPGCIPGQQCIHTRCVNPWHVRLVASRQGIYERDVNYDIDSTERANIYQRRQRAKRKKEKLHDTEQGRPANPQGLAPD